LVLITACIERRGREFSDTSCSLSDRYAQAIAAAGGIPWVLPCLPDEGVLAEAVRRCDGVMLTGGDDIDPRLYADRLPPRLLATVTPTTPLRDATEVLLIREVFRQRKALLAICRGHQLLNLALGGTLCVDIRLQVPGALNHQRLDRKDQVVHKVALTPDSILTKIAGTDTLGVNSSHHQAVARVAKPLRVTATSPDGIVEGLELAGGDAPGPVYLQAVQFHPERMVDRYPAFRELFRSFTRACRPSRKQTV
jgi:putative glutamine amidotransferase